MLYTFAPNYEVIREVQPFATIKDLEREVGVYSATPDFVRRHCGDIGKYLLSIVPETYYAKCEELKLLPNIDIRIHRLYPGDLPAYPGWHCDGEFRETYFSQPDLERVKVSNHLACTISSSPLGISNTQYLDQPFSAMIKEPSRDNTLWGQIHNQLEQVQAKKVFDSRDGQMVLFDSWTLHRAMPAKIRGWRMFFRMSMWHKPNLGDGGMVTKQEQVYKLVEGSGW
jgi:hypothetical protein